MSSLLDALIAAEEFPPLKGDRGAKGDVGDKGDKGDTGYQGLEGPTGPMGPDGPKGDQGPEGPEGKRGPKGLKGDDGEKGDKGDEGPPGRDGGVAGGRSYNVRGFASGMVIDDEGTKLNSGAVVGEIDFVGSGVSTAIVGSKAVVTVAGGSGLPSGGTVGQVVTNTGPGAGDWEDASGGVPVVGQDSFGVDHTFRLDMSGNPAGGSFTLIFGGQETAAIAYNAEAFEVGDALMALSNIPADGIEAYASGFAQSLAVAPKAVILNWANSMGQADRDGQVTLGQNNLTGGTSPDIAVSTWYFGSAPSAEVPVAEVGYQTPDSLINLASALGGLRVNIGTDLAPDWRSVQTIAYRDPTTGLPRGFFQILPEEVKFGTFDKSGGVWTEVTQHTPAGSTDPAYIRLDILDYFEEITRQLQIDTNGFKLTGLPTADPAVAGYLWNATGNPVMSGATLQTYTASNVTTDRAFNANATSIDELADVLGTLIVDLRAKGLVA